MLISGYVVFAPMFGFVKNLFNDALLVIFAATAFTSVTSEVGHSPFHNLKTVQFTSHIELRGTEIAQFWKTKFILKNLKRQCEKRPQCNEVTGSREVLLVAQNREI